MPERLGPFYPDATAMEAEANGNVLGIDAGDGCTDVESMKVWIRGSVVDLPARFFRRDTLSILFTARDGMVLPECCEAYLRIEYVVEHPA